MGAMAAVALLVLGAAPGAAALVSGGSGRDFSQLPSQGVRREAYWSGTHFTLSCERVAGHSGLSGEHLNWVAGREAFRRFADAPLSLESRGAVSNWAWDFSGCWCSCGDCKEMFSVCALGATTALAAMLIAISVTQPTRVANFMNILSTCSEADPRVMLFESLPPWPELLHSGWPLFGVLAHVAEQMREDGLEEWHLAHIYTQQRRRQGDSETPATQASTFCGVLGYHGGPAFCPLGAAEQLVRTALALARQASRRRQGLGVQAPIDALEALVRRAQDQVQSLLLRVPGRNRCMQAQNLGLGLSIAVPGLWRDLAKLQRLVESWLHVVGPPSPASEAAGGEAPAICPVSGARWQGEWLSETDFLRDYRAELEASLAAHPVFGLPVVGEEGHAAAEPASVAVADITAASRREAWACTLFAGSEVPWRQVALHAELVRTLAHSVRSLSRQQRPFLVLTEHTLPEDIAAELRADGLRLEHFDPAPLLLNVPEDRLWQVSWWSGRSLRPTMGQLAVWNLTDYDQIVMLDDDMLMVRPCDELFTIPVFAMSHDPAPWALQHKASGGTLHRLNNAARVVQPDAQLFQEMVHQIQSGALADHQIVNFWGYDLQSLEDAFWSRRSPRLGTTVFEEGEGAFVGCSFPNASQTKPAQQGEKVFGLGEEHRETLHCVLPLQYNFFVDYKSIFGLVYYGLSGVDMLESAVRGLMHRAVQALVDQGSLTARPKILHWPGDNRKPWQRLHPRVRNAWDDAWWQSHAAMCSSSKSPCRIACELGSPPNASA